MRRLRGLLVILLMSAASLSLASDVQVFCEPALRVYLDGKFVGTSSVKDDGFYLTDVRLGPHVIRVEKDGFAPQSFRVTLDKFPTEVRVGEFSPTPLPPKDKPTASPAPPQLPGNLIVISAPQNCSVELDGKPQLKTIPVLRIEGLAAGEHMLAFSRPGYNPISRAVWIDPGDDLTIRGDLKEGKVEIIHEAMGSLRLNTTPDHCTVQFLGKTIDKTDKRLNITYVPAGKHRLVVSWAGRELSSDILIIGGQRAEVDVSFIQGAQPFAVSYETE